MSDAVARILAAAARGDFPPADGTVTVLPQPGVRDAGVLAFTAHTVVFTDEDPAWVRATLGAVTSDVLAAPMNPAFLTALMARTGRRMNTIDLLTAAPALPGAPGIALREIHDQDHPRVARAVKFRDDVRVWAADGGLVVLGRGVAGRWEAAIEVDEAAQQSPGNARGVRTFQAAGYRPVGSEALLVAD
ncbi:GCN5 family acetyltransferase [Streptomyces sp. 150FB]|uniref:hypothetical protein n=1 Tax=Streptomyces sp. 150FB TaxID=1576605 RepID=UPI0005892823|nr:hypothetical protein [Streptomyces sp. 150FB]KIF76812.1 GCN5 family acetyltransferase [Streptomyces sp. 150FB]